METTEESANWNLPLFISVNNSNRNWFNYMKY